MDGAGEPEGVVDKGVCVGRREVRAGEEDGGGGLEGKTDGGGFGEG